MTAIFDNAAKAIAALDFTAEVEAVSQLSAEAAKISDAMQRAMNRLGEIGFLINSHVPEREAGREIADAMLDGEGATEAAKKHAVNRDALSQERADLSAGLGELRRRENAIGQELRELQDKARDRLSDPLLPVVAEVLKEAKEAAETLTRAFAMLQGLAIATRVGTGEAGTLGQAVARLWGLEIVKYRPRLDVPEGVAELLAPLSQIGEALPVTAPAWVAMPDDMRAMNVIASTEARRAVG